MLCRLLKPIVAQDCAMGKSAETNVCPVDALEDFVGRTVGATVIDEVVEIIELPEWNALAARNMDSHEEIILDPFVVQQIRGYIHIIASFYRENSFHNFEHVRIASPKA